VSHIPHTGDILLKTRDGKTIMYEMKTKTRTTKEDIFKFESDVENGSFDAAVLATSSFGIPNKGEFELNMVGKVPVLYVSNVMNTPKLLHIGTYLLCRLTQYLSTHTNEHTESMMTQVITDLSSVLTHTSVILELLRSNAKVFERLSRDSLEQKRMNEERIVTVMTHVDTIFHKYENFTGFQVSTDSQLSLQSHKHASASETALSLFHIINQRYNAMIEEHPGKTLTHRDLLQSVIEHGQTQYTTIDRLLKLWPKSKFHQQRVKLT